MNFSMKRDKITAVSLKQDFLFDLVGKFGVSFVFLPARSEFCCPEGF